jgi:hypothetical protein
VSDLSLLATSTSGRWRLVGMLQNDSAFPARSITIDASLIDGLGRAHGTQEIVAAESSLEPGERTPFEAFFFDAAAGSRAAVHVSGYRPAEARGEAADLSGLEAAPTGVGGLAVFGRVRAPGDSAVLIRDLAIALRAPGSGELIGVAHRTAGLTRLEAGQSAPFLALAQDISGTPTLDGYVRVERAPAFPTTLPFLPAAPGLSWTDQGRPFVVGQVKNPSPATMATAIVVRLQTDGRLLGLADIGFAVPLAPGEIRPFCVEAFPGMDELVQGSGIEPAALELDVRVDPGRTGRVASDAVPLAVRVTGYEHIGSRLVMRGEAENEATSTQRVVILASALSTDGEPLSAASLTLDEPLVPGRGVSFLVTMPWPGDTSPAMAEFDVRAFGLAP